MRKILFSLILFLGIINHSYSQLTAESKMIQKEAPEAYSKIKKSALLQWTKGGNTDHEMVVYTINNQVEAWIKVGRIASTLTEGSEKFRILASAMDQWTKNGLTDFEMTIYTYENQMENLDY